MKNKQNCHNEAKTEGENVWNLNLPLKKRGSWDQHEKHWSIKRWHLKPFASSSLVLLHLFISPSCPSYLSSDSACLSPHTTCFPPSLPFYQSPFTSSSLLQHLCPCGRGVPEKRKPPGPYRHLTDGKQITPSLPLLSLSSYGQCFHNDSLFLRHLPSVSGWPVCS